MCKHSVLLNISDICLSVHWKNICTRTCNIKLERFFSRDWFVDRIILDYIIFFLAYMQCINIFSLLHVHTFTSVSEKYIKKIEKNDNCSWYRKKHFTTNFVQKYFSEETIGYQILTILNCVLLHSFQCNILFLKNILLFKRIWKNNMNEKNTVNNIM